MAPSELQKPVSKAMLLLATFSGSSYKSQKRVTPCAAAWQFRVTERSSQSNSHVVVAVAGWLLAELNSASHMRPSVQPVQLVPDLRSSLRVRALRARIARRTTLGKPRNRLDYESDSLSGCKFVCGCHICGICGSFKNWAKMERISFGHGGFVKVQLSLIIYTSVIAFCPRWDAAAMAGIEPGPWAWQC